MDKYKISVVMPCFNVEAYLSMSVQSVLDQDYANFEIILVDDCSTDGTGKLCDSFAASYPFIRVIHNEVNKGISESRNIGFSTVVDSDYVFFMDSDDKIEDNLFSSVVNSLETNKAQIVVYGLVEDYYDNDDNFMRDIKVTFPMDMILKNKQEVRNEIIYIEELTLYGYVWNKFYSVPFLRDSKAQFTPIPLIEDIKFNVEVFQEVETVNLLAFTPYHYKKRSDAAGSLTSRFVPEYFEVSRARVELVYNQLLSWGMLGNEEKRILGKIYVRYIFSAIQRNCDKRAEMNVIKRYMWIKNLYKDSLLQDLIQYADTSNKIILIMVKLIRYKLSVPCLLLGRLIHIVKTKSPDIFSKVKQNR